MGIANAIISTNIEWNHMGTGSDGDVREVTVKSIYVREGADYVGPFASLEDAKCFVALIDMFGGSSDGIEVVELADTGAKDGKYCCGF
jgi:hypothetical protein